MDEELRKILVENGLEKYVSIFSENGIDSKAILSELSESDLEKLGITIMGDRKKILKLAIHEEPQSKKGDGNVAILRDNMYGWLKKKIGFYEEGILTLFHNRLEWQGKTSLTISMDKIHFIDVRSGIIKKLEIIDTSGNPYFFQKTSLQDVNPIFMTLLGSPQMLAASTLTVRSAQLEEWKRTIKQLKQEGTQS